MLLFAWRAIITSHLVARSLWYDDAVTLTTSVMRKSVLERDGRCLLLVILVVFFPLTYLYLYGLRQYLRVNSPPHNAYSPLRSIPLPLPQTPKRLRSCSESKGHKKQKKNENENGIKKARAFLLLPFLSELDERRDTSQLDLDSRVGRCGEEEGGFGGTAWTWAAHIAMPCHGPLPQRKRDAAVVVVVYS